MPQIECRIYWNAESRKPGEMESSLFKSMLDTQKPHQHKLEQSVKDSKRIHHQDVSRVMVYELINRIKLGDHHD